MISKEPLFILGCPKSGTTLLASIFTDTTYGAPFESHFITKYYKKLSTYGDLNNKLNFKRLINDIANERYIQQWGFKINSDILYDSLDQFDYASIVNKLCMLRNNRLGYSSWGDKTPHYTLDIDILYTLFPNSKYIFIVRDGRDVALSLLREPWGPGNIYKCAQLWCKYHEEKSALIALKNSKNLIMLKYEDFLDNPEIFVPKIYDFIEIDYRSNKFEKFYNTIKKGNYNKWMCWMTKNQKRIFSCIASNTLEKFGYKTNSNYLNISIIEKFLYEIHGKLYRYWFLFKINIIDGFKIRFLGKQPFAE